MLRSIWRSLNEKQRIILRHLAESVRPETEERLLEYLGGMLNWNQYSRALRILKSLDLIVVKPGSSKREMMMELHPVVRQFVRTAYPPQDRAPFIARVIVVFDRFITMFRKELTSRPPFGVLEHWTVKAELLLNSRRYDEAIRAVLDVAEALRAGGHSEEFVRVAGRLFGEVDLVEAVGADYKGLDSLVQHCAKVMSELGRSSELDVLLERYAESIGGKSARYINLCDLRTYQYWMEGDYVRAKEWGERGVRMKESSNLDTRFDAAHHLALARRDSDQVGEALAYFLGGETIEQIVAAAGSEDAQNRSSRLGNIGRCLWVMGDLARAIVCLRASALLLEDEYGSVTQINRGWAALWLGDALHRRGEVELAYLFFRRAGRIWAEVAPLKAEAARTRITNLIQAAGGFPISQDRDDAAIEQRCTEWLHSG